MAFLLRGPVLLVAALLLAGCGADEPAPGAAPPTTSGLTPTESGARLPEPSAAPDRLRESAGIVPHQDSGVDRAGEVPTRRTVCTLHGRPAFSFDGTVAQIDDGGGTAEVTFEVTESFLGELPRAWTVEMGAPVTGRASESGASYSVGTRLLVSGAAGVAWGCGATVYYDEEVAAERRS